MGFKLLVILHSPILIRNVSCHWWGIIITSSLVEERFKWTGGCQVAKGMLLMENLLFLN